MRPSIRRRVPILAILVCGCSFDEGPHTPLPHVVNAGGPVLASPRWAAVTFSGDPLTTAINTFLEKLGASDYWKTALGEYGVGGATTVAVNVFDTPPVTIDDTGIQSYLDAHLNPVASGWPAPDANIVYALYYPEGTTITETATESLCGAELAYHSSFELINGTQIAYAVMPRCVDFAENPLDELTEVSSHELAESATDPFVDTSPAYSSASDFAWQEFSNGGEVADMCQDEPGSFVVDPELGAFVQHIWSNVQAAAGHDPCVPHLDGDVYFQAAPVETGTIMLTFGTTGRMTSGLQISVGATKTVDVQLFSDGPTDQITVGALEYPSNPAVEQPGDLTLAWDTTSGSNGDTLHLTITVNSDNAGEGHEYFIIFSQVGDLERTWPVAIAN